jgi:membrane-bound ClpP family serine protease
LQAEAVNLMIDIGQARWLLFEQSGSSISRPFLVVLVFWLTILFISFGLFAPRNGTIVVTMFVCALSVAGAIFLILELDQPFSGLIRISSAPLHSALSRLGR